MNNNICRENPNNWDNHTKKAVIIMQASQTQQQIYNIMAGKQKNLVNVGP